MTNQISHSEKLDQAWKINSYLNSYIQLADTKAGAIVAITALSVSSLSVINEKLSIIERNSIIFSTFMIIIGGIFSLIVVIPRFRSTQRTSIFWMDMLGHGNLNNYRSDFNNSDLLDEVIITNYNLLQIAKKKYTWLRNIMILQIFAIFAFWSVIILIKFL